MKTKKCNRCKLTKPVNLFTEVRYPSGNTGYSFDCKDCRRKYMRLHRSKPETKLQRKRHYEANRERLIQNALKRKNRDDYRFNTIFVGLKRRCTNPKADNYKYYGGRGIKVLWNSYADFKKDMYQGYLQHELNHGTKNTTLDRIDVNGNYCKENCRWATWQIQHKNKRPI